MRGWADIRRDELAAMFPSHEIWFVPQYMSHAVWCSRPKGHPVATINAGSPEELVAKIAEAAAEPMLAPKDDNPTG